MADSVSIDFTVASADPCAGAFTPIPQLQGDGPATPASGTVTTEGVVVGDYEGPSPTLRGFFIQDALGDADAATSDGIFVFNGSANSVDLGDNVRVIGTIGEFQGQTQISSSTIVDCTTTDTVAPTDVTFPVASSTFLERYEGMLVRLPQTMVVTEHFLLGRFGQVTLSAERRLDQPTAVVDPGAAALQRQADNDLRKIILDDGNNGQNQDPIVFARGGQPLSASNTLRGGDTATNIVGVLNWTFGGDAIASPNAYRVRPVNALGGGVTFEPTNPRPTGDLALDGAVRVAGMNLLNYFNTFDGLPDRIDNCTNGVGGLATDCRGADTAFEFGRQWPKTIDAILGMDADVIGVNEIENDGYGPTSAIADLVDRLNAAVGPGTYAYIDVDAATGKVNALGLDAIKVGMIYRPATVTPVGQTAALDSLEFISGGDAIGPPPLPPLRSRPSLAQAFEVNDTGARFVVDVNHLKSKGSACDHPDAGDGQGNCNDVRTVAATALAEWLASDPTGTGDDDVYIVGDLNSYANEDPVVALEDAGYTNIVDALIDDPYSYVFDGQWGYLDYALGSAAGMAEVADVAEWHINADEPSVLDYNSNFKPAPQLTSLYAPDRFRVSDHDPIVLGLDPVNDPPSVDAGGPYLVIEHGSVELTASGSDPEGTALTFDWDLDDDGTFEATGATVGFSAALLEAPQTVTVTVRATDAFGHASTDTAAITVIWEFGGFDKPSTPGGTTVIKAGASHPVKFSLDGDQGMAVLDGAPTLQRTDCSTGADIGQPITAVVSEPFAYDPLTDQYKFAWKTEKAWVGWCGTLTVHLADAQDYPLAVRFR
jgi:predicted extracellular nuclease